MQRINWLWNCGTGKPADVVHAEGRQLLVLSQRRGDAEREDGRPKTKADWEGSGALIKKKRGGYAERQLKYGLGLWEAIEYLV